MTSGDSNTRLLPRKNSAKHTRLLQRAQDRGDNLPAGEEPEPSLLDLDQSEASASQSSRLNFGICLSGGGIRAASYSLGVLQRMEDEGMVHGADGARYLSCVSGGSYMGTAITGIERGRFPDEPDGETIIQPSATMAAYAQDSPEVTYLRDNTKYLTHGWGGLPVAVWRLLLGVGWNFLLLTMGVLLFAVPIGWIYGSTLTSLRQSAPPGSVAHTTLAFPDFVFWVPAALGALGVILGFIWVGGLWTKAGVRKVLAGLSLGALGAAVGWLLVVVVAPIILEWIRQSFESTTHASVGGTAGATTSSAAAAGSTLLLSGLTAIFGARAIRTADSWWNQLSQQQQSKVLSRVWHLVLRYRTPLLNLLALLVGPATILALLVFGMQIGALYPPGVGTGGDAWLPPLVFGIGAIGLLLLWCYADLTAWSLHPFYRERLSNAFVLKRLQVSDGSWSPTATMDEGTRVDAAPRSYDGIYKISDAQDVDMPELITCAAANVSSYGAAPTGAPVTSFVFSKAEIGGPIVGAWSAGVYESVLGPVDSWRRTITSPGAMAMSGAAVSPEMGRLTRRPLRFLLTMANIRLGVWVPNPNRLQEFELRANSYFRRLRLRPRISYLLREMFGFNDPESLFLYVTDGGHYENLGLVELVRRECEYVWCVDASGDKQDTFSTLAGAVRLARDELGVEIDIHPETMAPNPDTTAERAKKGLKPVVEKTFCEGTILYPGDGKGKPAREGRLVVIKAGVPADAPLGISTFYENNPAFPCDSTLDQLYSADRFDAYRELGFFSADQALSECLGAFDAFRGAGKEVGTTRGTPHTQPKVAATKLS
jgi:hypothetical protein